MGAGAQDLAWGVLSRPPTPVEGRADRSAEAAASVATLARLGLSAALGGGLAAIRANGRTRVARVRALDPSLATAADPLREDTLYLSPLLAHNLGLADAGFPARFVLLHARALDEAQQQQQLPAAAEVVPPNVPLRDSTARLLVLSRVQVPFLRASTPEVAAESARALRAHFRAAPRTLALGDLLAIPCGLPRTGVFSGFASGERSFSDGGSFQGERSESPNDDAESGSECDSELGPPGCFGAAAATAARRPVRHLLYVVTALTPGATAASAPAFPPPFAAAAAHGDVKQLEANAQAQVQPAATVGDMDGSGVPKFAAAVLERLAEDGRMSNALKEPEPAVSQTVAVGITVLIERGLIRSRLPPGLSRYISPGFPPVALPCFLAPTQIAMAFAEVRACAPSMLLLRRVEALALAPSSTGLRVDSASSTPLPLLDALRSAAA
ncbi:hypothetical protein T492DRAFT_1140702, partial [Pavlovales sp. CCMP2436]